MSHKSPVNLGRGRRAMVAGLMSWKKRDRKPEFTVGRLVSSTDMQRKFKEKVEPALAEHPFVVVLTSAEPRLVILNYPV